MTQSMTEILDQMHVLQTRLEEQLEEKRAALGLKFKGKAVEFEHDVRDRHRALRQGAIRFLREAPLCYAISSPIIYSMIVPLVLLDLWASLYQAICFRIYGIPQVKRSDYVLTDHHRLSYLNGIEILNCLFCSYANGIIGYAREIASRTEQYWCPIKHALRLRDPHRRYNNFLDYGDAEGYRSKLDSYRDEVRKVSAATNGQKT